MLRRFDVAKRSSDAGPQTIARFRQQYDGQTIGNVCREIMILCRQLGLFVETLVAIDSIKFKAVNNRD